MNTGELDEAVYVPDMVRRVWASFPTHRMFGASARDARDLGASNIRRHPDGGLVGDWPQWYWEFSATLGGRDSDPTWEHHTTAELDILRRASDIALLGDVDRARAYVMANRVNRRY